MKNKKIKLQELFQIREDLIIEGKNINEINKLIEEAEYDYIDSIHASWRLLQLVIQQKVIKKILLQLMLRLRHRCCSLEEEASSSESEPPNLRAPMHKPGHALAGAAAAAAPC
jgi:hypothetical protein